MALTTLYGRGGGRIPFGDNRYLHLTSARLTQILAAMPNRDCGALHRASRSGDVATAQQMLRDAAVAFMRKHEADLTDAERDLLTAVAPQA